MEFSLEEYGNMDYLIYIGLLSFIPRCQTGHLIFSKRRKRVFAKPCFFTNANINKLPDALCCAVPKQCTMPDQTFPLFHIVLHAPEIPQNTGNIGRIACNTGCRLHLIEPIPFSFDDKHLKRAGMDYWHHVDCQIHPDWQTFYPQTNGAPIYFFSTKAKQSYWDCPFEPGSFLVFGSESCGLPQYLHDTFAPQFYTIPMPGNFYRSLNLANSVAIAVYEGLRKQTLRENA